MKNIIYKDPNVTIFQSAVFQTNTTLVTTDDVVLLVDPAWLPEEVLSIRNYVAEIKGDRELFIIFTHSDYDHIIGYRAFKPDRVFMSKAMEDNPNKELCIEQILDFDENWYIKRPYPIEYPNGDFIVFRDAVQFRHQNTKMTFYLTPGHTADCMMVVVWQIGLCIAGDYLSDIEFPLIGHSSVEYEATLNKLPGIHDRNWFTRLVPGHGSPALSINDWLQRRTESLAYIYALRESIATGIPFDETSLWERYPFSRIQQKFHTDNVALMTKEYENGLWTWDPEFSMEMMGSHKPQSEQDENPQDEYQED